MQDSERGDLMDSAAVLITATGLHAQQSVCDLSPIGEAPTEAT